MDDGIFCMLAEDVLQFFTVLVVARDYPSNYHAYEFSQEWKVQDGFVKEQKDRHLQQDSKQVIFTNGMTG